MADSKITALTALTAADPANDMLPIVDVSDNLITATGTTKRISINNILACSPSATLASATITGQLVAASTSGHIGFGTTPSAWGSSIKGVDVGAWASVAQIGASSFLGFNSYASTTGQFNYKNTGAIALGYFQQSGGHLWLNAPSNAGAAGANATFTTAMTLDTSGRLLIGPTSANASGGILQLSSGITFPATQVSSSDANTLDDYREGTWTPTVTASSGTPTTTTVNSASYTKVGRLVAISFDFSIVSKGTATGSLSFTLPFNQTSDTNCGSFRENAGTGFMGQVFYGSSTNISCLLYDNSTVWVDGYRIRGTYTYFAS